MVMVMFEEAKGRFRRLRRLWIMMNDDDDRDDDGDDDADDVG